VIMAYSPAGTVALVTDFGPYRAPHNPSLPHASESERHSYGF
jgi:hypothetical protein